MEQSDIRQSGGMAALQMAEAHLTTDLGSIDAVDSRAMFLVGLNVAGAGIFTGAVAALSWSLVCLIAPLALATLTVVVGLWCLWPRRVPQFPAADELLTYRTIGATDDQLAWANVESISKASDAVRDLLARKIRLTLLLFVLTVAQLAAIAATAAVCAS